MKTPVEQAIARRYVRGSSMLATRKAVSDAARASAAAEDMEDISFLLNREMLPVVDRLRDIANEQSTEFASNSDDYEWHIGRFGNMFLSQASGTPTISIDSSVNLKNIRAGRRFSLTVYNGTGSAITPLFSSDFLAESKEIADTGTATWSFIRKDPELAAPAADFIDLAKGIIDHTHVEADITDLDSTDDKAARILNVQYADAAVTGSSEEDLHSYTMPANTLSADGDAIEIMCAMEYTSAVTAKQVHIYLGSTVIFETLNSSTLRGDHSIIKVIVVRTGSSAQRVIGMHLFDDVNSGLDNIDYTTASEDLTTALVVKNAGDGAGVGEIVSKMFSVTKWPAP